METLKTILNDILIIIYHNVFGAVAFAILAMCVKLFATEYGIKKLVSNWVNSFLHDRKFVIQFIFFIYVFIVFSETVIGRSIWNYPLENVIGTWTMHIDGEINNDLFENLFMLMPYIALMFAAFPQVLEHKSKGKSRGFINITSKSFLFSFCTSLSIEMIQLIFKLGTFQLSDPFFNTVGGAIGGFIYFIIIKIRKAKTS